MNITPVGFPTASFGVDPLGKKRLTEREATVTGCQNGPVGEPPESP